MKKKPTRISIRIDTLAKIRSFLEEQIAPIYRSEIVRAIGIDYNSLKIALKNLEIKEDKKGRIYLKSNKKIK